MSVPKLKRADNGIYYIHWTDGRRSKRVSTGAQEMDAAKAFLGQWLLMDQNTEVPEQHITVRDLWALYYEKHVTKNVMSVETVDYSWKNLERFFGDMTLPQVTQDAADAYVAKRERGAIGRPSVSATIRRELNILKSCFSWCAHPRRKLLKETQVPVFDLPPDSEPRDRWLSIHEIQRLLRAAADMRRGGRLSRGERFLWLALETAARKEAICQLTWDRVDFHTGVIHYDVPGRKKTKKRRASPPISKALRTVLERAYAERETDYVLDHQGEVIKTIKLIAERAGVEGVSPHVLRHTAATHMARNGVPLWVVAGILGNSMQMVEKVYAKHSPDGLRGGVELISGGQLEVMQ